jgi:hypothetical protein
MVVRRLVTAVVAACLAGGLLASVRAPGASYPACFGAASRDPAHPCRNAELSFSVVPTPSEALIMPNTPCAPIRAPIDVCAFGAPAATSRATSALLGDSHAWHWRGSVDLVTRALNWRALSITRSKCPFSLGRSLLPEPIRAQCIAWNRGVLRWFAKHPEVSTVFTSTHGGAVSRSRGQSPRQAQLAGIITAWRALPATVKHIVVIRDIPDVYERTLPCVEAAIAEHREAGTACAVARSAALHEDPDVVAARRLGLPRVQVVDLTQFFCDGQLCYPVVGGALVYRDSHHITSTFAMTLAPFLLAQLNVLMASWG